MIRIGTSQQSATGVSTRMMTGSWQHLRVPGSRGPRHRQRGAVSVEAVLLLPLVILIVSAATASWRVWQPPSPRHGRRPWPIHPVRLSLRELRLDPPNWPEHDAGERHCTSLQTPSPDGSVLVAASVPR